MVMKKLPLSEKELIKGLDSDKAHADLLPGNTLESELPEWQSQKASKVLDKLVKKCQCFLSIKSSEDSTR
jgi:hypothetical protein